MSVPDNIKQVIEGFNERCAARGHWFAPDPLAVGQDRCTACGAVQAAPAARFRREWKDREPRRPALSPQQED